MAKPLVRTRADNVNVRMMLGARFLSVMIVSDISACIFAGFMTITHRRLDLFHEIVNKMAFGVLCWFNQILEHRPVLQKTLARHIRPLRRQR